MLKPFTSFFHKFPVGVKSLSRKTELSKTLTGQTSALVLVKHPA